MMAAADADAEDDEADVPDMAARDGTRESWVPLERGWPSKTDDLKGKAAEEIIQGCARRA